MAAIPSESPADRLAEAFRDLPEVRLALLFGSRARGSHRDDSDFDLGVLLDDDVARADRGAALRRLAGRLGRVVSSTLLDVVVLDGAPAVLRHRVVRDGILLHARTPEERVRFAVATIRDYQHQQVRRDGFTRARIRRLASEGTHGGSGDIRDKARGVARLLGQAGRVP